jgi:hypothetical protein
VANLSKFLIDLLLIFNKLNRLNNVHNMYLFYSIDSEEQERTTAVYQNERLKVENESLKVKISYKSDSHI